MKEERNGKGDEKGEKEGRQRERGGESETEGRVKIFGPPIFSCVRP